MSIAIGMNPGPRIEIVPGAARKLTKVVQDDASGNIAGGLINYGTGEVTGVSVLDSDIEYNTYSTTVVGNVVTAAEWTTATGSQTWVGPGSVTYALASAVASGTQTGAVNWSGELEIDILQSSQDALVPGTVRFRLGTVSYSDRDGLSGLLYLADGSQAGTIDYGSGKARITEWSGITSGTVTIDSCLSARGEYHISSAYFRAASAPLAPGSLQVVAVQDDGDGISATGDTDGLVTGDGIDTGTVEHDIGAVALTFDEPVFPSTLKYSATAFTIIPLDPAIIGIDPVRLPPDGRVPIIRAGDYVVIYEDGTTALTNPAVAGATYAVGQTDLAFSYLSDGAGEQTESLPAGLVPDQVIALTTNGRTGPLEYLVLEDARARPVNGGLYDADLDTWTITLPATFSADGYEQPFIARFLPLVDPADYVVDRDDGTITMADPLDLTGYTQPLDIVWRVHDLALCVEAQTTGTITLQSALGHDYTTAAGISAMLLHGDLKARVANQFEQHTDTGTWLDYLSGSAPTGGGRYDWTGYPVYVSNNGAVRERWRIKRRSDGQWDVIGETLGVIGVWNGSSTLQAKRSASQAVPYFILYHEGLGAGWATGNFIQFETFGAQGPLWVLRSVRPGKPTVATDAVRLRHRVGAD